LNMVDRQIVLDTETTGLETQAGHRIIEIGCVEIQHRRLTGRHFHVYLQPDRRVDPDAVAIHGLTDEFLADKPRMTDILDEFLDFVDGAELVIHNAAFDVGFLNHELQLAGRVPSIDQRCGVLDTLNMARRLHPGQKNNLDALCKRYDVDNSQRDLHGALLDAEILARVYLAMTGGQEDLLLEEEPETVVASTGPQVAVASYPPLPVRWASAEELAAHDRYLERLDSSSGGQCIWRRLAGVITEAAD